MQKAPIYIGIFCEDGKKGGWQMKEYSKECMKELKQWDKQGLVAKDYEGMDEVYAMPKDSHHITTLFIGGESKKLHGRKQQNYMSFKKGMQIKVKIELFVLVPNCIMVGYCPNVPDIEIDNKYPHITLFLTKDTKPMESNTVLEAIFQNHSQLMEEQFLAKRLDIKYKHSNCIYVLRKAVLVDMVTGDNFTHGRR